MGSHAAGCYIAGSDAVWVAAFAVLANNLQAVLLRTPSLLLMRLAALWM
jgi:hypothetical protein